KAIKEYANSKGIRLIGDAPIFVSSDSADVWANSELFYLDERRRPTVVAGVPPDYFSSTGQLWGDPLYNWEALARTGDSWWGVRVWGGGGGDAGDAGTSGRGTARPLSWVRGLLGSARRYAHGREGTLGARAARRLVRGAA